MYVFYVVVTGEQISEHPIVNPWECFLILNFHFPGIRYISFLLYKILTMSIFNLKFEGHLKKRTVLTMQQKWLQAAPVTEDQEVTHSHYSQ